MLEVIDHTNSPVWTEANQRLCGGNGAVNYSKAIAAYYLPVFRELFQNDERRVCMCTVTKESGIVKLPAYDLLFVFCHQCSWYRQNSVAWAKGFARVNPNVVFIVWHEDYARVLEQNGLKAIFIPMGIDLKELEQYKRTPRWRHRRRIIWYGNIRPAKRPYFQHFKSECEKAGLHLDYISGDRLNGERWLSREEIMWELQNYRVGVGVGICAHEMAALGLKVILYSYNFKCNCAWTPSEAEYYIHRNLCSDNETDTLIADALERRDYLCDYTPVDIANNAELLRQKLIKFIR